MRTTTESAQPNTTTQPNMTADDPYASACRSFEMLGIDFAVVHDGPGTTCGECRRQEPLAA